MFLVWRFLISIWKNKYNPKKPLRFKTAAVFFNKKEGIILNLVRFSRPDSDPVTQQLGLDMLKVGGGTCEQIAEVMISNGDVIEALKWHKIENNYEFKCKKAGIF